MLMMYATLQIHISHTNKRNDVNKMKYCDYYNQMTYRDFIEFEKQNDENATFEISTHNND